MDSQQDSSQEPSQQERYEMRKQEKSKKKAQMSGRREMHPAVRWVLVGVVVLLGIWGLANLGGHSEDAGDDVAVPLTDEVTDQDWTKGPSDAKVRLVEYSDFQCPACLSYEPLIKQIIEEFPNDVQFVYRHFPLRQIHPNAELAAYAAEAAGMQGKFWEMHDLLFETQSDWSKEKEPKNTFMQYAGSLELDTEKFAQDIELESVKNKVDAHYQSGVRSRINATPTFFVNGEKISSPRNLDEFKSSIQQAIDKTNS